MKSWFSPWSDTMLRGETKVELEIRTGTEPKGALKRLDHDLVGRMLQVRSVR